MTTKKLLITVPNSWPEELQHLATTRATSVSHLIRLAIEAHYGLTMDWTDFDYRNPRPKTKAVHKATTPSNKVSIQTDLPRRMEWVLKAVAKQHNIGISSIINMLLYANLKHVLPSKPDVNVLATAMWKNVPLPEAPEIYHVRVHISKDWDEPLREYCKANNETVSDLLRRLIMKKFGHLRVPDSEGNLPPMEDGTDQPTPVAQPTEPIPANA